MRDKIVHNRYFCVGVIRTGNSGALSSYLNLSISAHVIIIKCASPIMYLFVRYSQRQCYRRGGSTKNMYLNVETIRPYIHILGTLTASISLLLTVCGFKWFYSLWQYSLAIYISNFKLTVSRLANVGHQTCLDRLRNTIRYIILQWNRGGTRYGSKHSITLLAEHNRNGRR